MICGQDSRTVRVQGFDTPETKAPGCAAEAVLGAQSTARLHALVKARPVTLTSAGEDNFGRVLARMTVGGEDVGDILVREGLAVRYTGGTRVNWCERQGG